MPRNTINDLRNHLFEAIEKIQCGEMEVKEARTLNDLAKTLVLSAKVEVQAAKVMQKSFSTDFIPEDRTRPSISGDIKEGRSLPASS